MTERRLIFNLSESNLFYFILWIYIRVAIKQAKQTGEDDVRGSIWSFVPIKQVNLKRLRWNKKSEYQYDEEKCEEKLTCIFFSFLIRIAFVVLFIEFRPWAKMSSSALLLLRLVARRLAKNSFIRGVKARKGIVEYI